MRPILVLRVALVAFALLFGRGHQVAVVTAPAGTSGIETALSAGPVQASEQSDDGDADDKDDDDDEDEDDD